MTWTAAQPTTSEQTFSNSSNGETKYGLMQSFKTPIVLPVSLSTTSLTYPSTTVGEASNSQSVTMTNTSGSALPITSIAVSGTNASSFVFANNCGTSLPAGANCTIHGHFAPAAVGAMKASIAIAYTGVGSPQTIALSGTGLTPPVTLGGQPLVSRNQCGHVKRVANRNIDQRQHRGIIDHQHRRHWQKRIFVCVCQQLRNQPGSRCELHHSWALCTFGRWRVGGSGDHHR